MNGIQKTIRAGIASGRRRSNSIETVNTAKAFSMSIVRRIRFTNQRVIPVVVFVEPECQDYWMNPGETFEVRAEISSANAEFELTCHDEGVSVYPDHDMGEITVHAGEMRLDCGHQRPTGVPTASDLTS